MADIKPIFDVLYNTMYAKVAARRAELIKKSAEFDSMSNILQGISYVTEHTDIRHDLERNAGVRLSVHDYRITLEQLIENERRLGVPEFTIGIRADMEYAKDFFKLYTDVVRKPDIDQREYYANIYQSRMNKIAYMMGVLTSQRIFGPHTALSFLMLDQQYLWHKVIVGQGVLRWTTDFDTGQCQRIYDIAEELNKGHNAFKQLSGNLLEFLKYQENVRRR